MSNDRCAFRNFDAFDTSLRSGHEFGHVTSRGQIKRFFGDGFIVLPSIGVYKYTYKLIGMHVKSGRDAFRSVFSEYSRVLTCRSAARRPARRSGDDHVGRVGGGEYVRTDVQFHAVVQRVRVSPREPPPRS